MDEALGISARTMQCSPDEVIVPDEEPLTRQIHGIEHGGLVDSRYYWQRRVRGVTVFRPLIESSDVLAKTPKEAKKIVAQQLSSELARCRLLRKGQVRYVRLEVEAARDYVNIGGRTSRVGAGRRRDMISLDDETIEERHEAAPNTRQDTDNKAPGTAGPTVRTVEGNLTSSVD